MRFVLKALLIGVLALAATSCGKSNNGSNSNAAASPSAPRSAFANESVEMFTEKEQAITQTIISPLVLHISGDDSDMIAKADAHAGTPYQYQSDVPSVYPCGMQYGVNAPQYWASLDDFGGAERSIGQWLLDSGWVTVSTHSFSWMGAAGVQSETFQCHQITDAPSETAYLMPRGPDAHSGLDISLLQRVCTRWDYFNAYEADVPGKGKVKMFAGRFEYKLVPLVAGLVANGTGIATVKFMADPDTGTWRMLEYQRSDDNTSVTWNAVPAGAKKIRPTPSGHCPGP